ncbi:hypothetical protein GIB67_023236 [Kingdonia uniflora]|uniref:Uncharacterized protein n=1 Tax=Kingdonia uniflora TaxID=39325 RepID=A0A7J7NVY2_9MAGN|nr:hypothetical protein GIB67_023236 [Kingdonia uniflora]
MCSLWQFCNEYVVPMDQLEFFKDITPQDIVCSQDYDSEEMFSIANDCASHLLPICNEDMIVRVFSKKHELVRKKNPFKCIRFLSSFGHLLYPSILFYWWK